MRFTLYLELGSRSVDAGMLDLLRFPARAALDSGEQWSARWWANVKPGDRRDVFCNFSLQTSGSAAHRGPALESSEFIEVLEQENLSDLMMSHDPLCRNPLIDCVPVERHPFGHEARGSYFTVWPGCYSYLNNAADSHRGVAATGTWQSPKGMRSSAHERF
jgi:hypothetical protein